MRCAEICCNAATIRGSAAIGGSAVFCAPACSAPAVSASKAAHTVFKKCPLISFESPSGESRSQKTPPVVAEIRILQPTPLDQPPRRIKYYQEGPYSLGRLYGALP